MPLQKKQIKTALLMKNFFSSKTPTTVIELSNSPSDSPAPRMLFSGPETSSSTTFIRKKIASNPDADYQSYGMFIYNLFVSFEKLLQVFLEIIHCTKAIVIKKKILLR